MTGFEAIHVHLPSISIGDLFDPDWAMFLFGVRAVKTDKCLPSMRVGNRHMPTFPVYNPEFMCNDHSIAAPGIKDTFRCCPPGELRAGIESEGTNTKAVSRMTVGSAGSRQRCRWPLSVVNLTKNEQWGGRTMSVDAERG